MKVCVFLFTFYVLIRTTLGLDTVPPNYRNLAYLGVTFIDIMTLVEAFYSRENII